MLIVEKDVEAYLRKKVEGLKGWCLKIPAVYHEGIPDRLVILPKGKIVFVELKRPRGGKLSPMQKYTIGKLKDLGCKVYILKNYKEIDAMLKEVMTDGV